MPASTLALADQKMQSSLYLPTSCFSSSYLKIMPSDSFHTPRISSATGYASGTRPVLPPLSTELNTPPRGMPTYDLDPRTCVPPFIVTFFSKAPTFSTAHPWNTYAYDSSTRYQLQNQSFYPQQPTLPPPPPRSPMPSYAYQDSPRTRTYYPPLSPHMSTSHISTSHLARPQHPAHPQHPQHAQHPQTYPHPNTHTVPFPAAPNTDWDAPPLPATNHHTNSHHNHHHHHNNTRHPQAPHDAHHQYPPPNPAYPFPAPPPQDRDTWPSGPDLASPASDRTPDEPLVKKKRKRADANQLRVLNATYQRTAFPSTQERESLAKELDMSPRSVQIWCAVNPTRQ